MKRENIKNKRLLNVFGKTHPYLNIEYSLPCVVKEVFTHKVIERHKSFAVIVNSSRVIIHPNTFHKLNKTRQDQVTIMASTWECGRVLELNEDFVINGKPYMVTVKGIGCTTFGRETSGEQNWLFGIPPASKYKIKQLQSYPYYKDCGALRLNNAKLELINERRILGQGVDVVRVVSIQEIMSLPDKNGILRSLDYFYKKSILENQVKIALIYRMQKTNIRLSDLILLREKGMTNSVVAVIDHAKLLFSIHCHVNNPSIEEYFYWLTEKLIKENLNIIFNNQELAAFSRWLVLARNISLMGETIDFESQFQNPNLESSKRLFLFHVQSSILAVERILRAIADIINTCYTEKIDFVDFAHVYFNSVVKHTKRHLATKARTMEITSKGKIKYKVDFFDDLRLALFHNNTIYYRSMLDQDKFQREILKQIHAGSINSFIEI
jgi:hypothetical protein